jgi:hypothetical protein
MRSLVIALVCAPSLALAQSLPQLDLNQIDINSNASSSMVVGTGDMLPAGAFRMSLAASYENNPAVSFQDGRLVGDVISDRFTFHLIGGWAPFDWLEFGADVPIVASQEGVDLSAYGLPRTGIGQPIALARMGLLSQGKGAWFDMAVQLGARLPFSERGRWEREQRIAIAPKLMVGRDLGFLRAGMEVGVRYRPDPTARGVDDPANQVLLAAALTSGRADSLRLELTARTTVSFARQRGPVDVLAGARMPMGIFDVFALAGPNFDAGPGEPSFKVITGIGFGSASGITGSATQSPTPGTLAPPPTGTDSYTPPPTAPSGYPVPMMPGFPTSSTAPSTPTTTTAETTPP